MIKVSVIAKEYAAASVKAIVRGRVPLPPEVAGTELAGRLFELPLLRPAREVLLVVDVGDGA